MKLPPATWTELEIQGRLCYVRQHDLDIFYGLMGNLTGHRKTVFEMPEDGYLITIAWTRVADQLRRHIKHWPPDAPSRSDKELNSRSS